MELKEAIGSRKSIRSFKSDPVPLEVIEEILTLATRAPSGGNVQPWKVYVATGAARDRLVEQVANSMKEGNLGEGSEYDIYPKDLGEPYMTRRRELAFEMYELLGIARDDKVGRAMHMARNFELFGAPVGLFFSIDRNMQQGQFVDIGIYLQTIMLLARDFGLHTCAQEAWSLWYKTVGSFFEIPDHEMFFCGMALGYADEDAAVNSLESKRAPLSEFAKFVSA